MEVIIFFVSVIPILYSL